MARPRRRQRHRRLLPWLPPVPPHAYRSDAFWVRYALDVAISTSIRVGIVAFPVQWLASAFGWRQIEYLASWFAAPLGWMLWILMWCLIACVALGLLFLLIAVPFIVYIRWKDPGTIHEPRPLDPGPLPPELLKELQRSNED